MIEVFINETENAKKLKVINACGEDVTSEYIEDNHEFSNDFTVSNGEYEVSEENFNKWVNIIQKAEKLDERIHQLVEKHGQVKVSDVHQYQGLHSSMKEIERVNRALDSAFGEE